MATTAVDQPRAVLLLMAALCGDPSRVDTAFQHAPASRFVIKPHRHDDVLQLDLIEGCEGRCFVEGTWRPIVGLTALCAYPGDEHGYDLSPLPGQAHVYHLKCRLDAAEPAVKRRVLRPYAPRLDDTRDLLTPMRLLTRAAAEVSIDAAEQVSRVAEVFALWPRTRGAVGRSLHDRSARNLEALDPRLSGAIRLLHRRLTDPPSLDELAAAAHLSPRQFARRFRELVGCTPHAYANARRVAAARDLLRDRDLRIVEIADRLGFSAPATFTRWFTQHVGQPPRRFRHDPASL